MLRRAIFALGVCTATTCFAQETVLFTGFDGTDWHLYTVAPGAEPVKRFSGETRGADVRNGMLAFADPAGDVFIQDAQLTAPDSPPIAGLPGPCAQPTLSPDAQTLVVACFRFANRQDDGAFYSVNLSDRSVTPLYDGAGLQKSPVFSPNGQMIAFVSGFRLSAERVIEHVWVMRADGTDATPVADASDINIDPTWLDNDTLVISSDMDLQGQKLWRIKLSTGEATPLTSGPSDMEVTAHPDGKLAFLAQVEDRFSLMLTDATGAQLPQVLAVSPADGLQAAHDPIWTTEFSDHD